jgi:D-alanyl-D-alanine carboxypeptidase (penicillin-binding protein 5/6)
MLSSGNDAAVAIAEHIGGSAEDFCRMMTARATELGCTNTVFLTPHGLPKEGHYTTARDLALIAREAMQHETFRTIASTQRAKIPWQGRSYDRVLNNKNKRYKKTQRVVWQSLQQRLKVFLTGLLLLLLLLLC